MPFMLPNQQCQSTQGESMARFTLICYLPFKGFLEAKFPSYRQTNSVKALKGKIITFHRCSHPKLTWGSSMHVYDH